jgi:hypothetical protein
MDELTNLISDLSEHYMETRKMEKKSFIKTLIAGAIIPLIAITIVATLDAAPQNPTLASGRGFYPILGRTADDWESDVPLGVARIDFMIKRKDHQKKRYGRLNYEIQLDGDRFPILSLVAKIEDKTDLPEEPPLSMQFWGSAILSGGDGDDTFQFTSIIDDGDAGFLPDHFMITIAGGDSIIFDPTESLSVDGGNSIEISGGDFVFISNDTVVIGVDPGDSYDIVDNDDPGWTIGDKQHSIIINGGDTVTVGGTVIPVVGTEPIIIDGGDTIVVSMGPDAGELTVAGTESLSVDGGANWIIAERDTILLGANEGDLIKGDIFIRMD